MIHLVQKLEKVEPWTHKVIFEECNKFALGLQVQPPNVFFAIRIIVTGAWKVNLGKKNMWEYMESLGKKQTIERLKNVLF